MNLVEQFSAYGRWREAAAEVVARLDGWLARNDMDEAQAGLRLQHLLERLREDRLTVAFVAEFSRGKSELINAIFFADYGDRVLPSSAGRTNADTSTLLVNACTRISSASLIATGLKIVHGNVLVIA